MALDRRNNRFFFACRLPGESEVQVFRPAAKAEDADAQLVYHSFKKWGIDVPVQRSEESLASLAQEEFVAPPFLGQAEYRSDYINTIERIVRQIQTDDTLEKVVLSRIHIESRPENYRPDLHFKALTEAYPDQAVHWIRWKGVGEWMGSSPELLLDIQGDRLKTMALAGTLPANRGEWSEKERIEQETVTQFIRKQLLDSDWVIEREDGPSDRIAGPVRHLETRFYASGQSNPRDLLNRLHPTPAVLGWPREQALNCIQENEPYSRAFYTGYWGLEQADHSRFYVNLRCLSLHEQAVVFYMGGGLNAHSNPEREWEETEEKRSAVFAHFHEAKHQ